MIFIIFVNFINDTLAEKPFHYVFMGTPSYGHFKPTLEIVEALTKLGQQVTYFSVPQFKNQIELVGAKFANYNSISAKNAQPVNSRSMDLSLAYQALNDVMMELWPTILEFMKTNNIDVIVYDQFAIWGKLIASQYNIPSICSSIMLLRPVEDWAKISTKTPINTNNFSYKEMLDCIACRGADKVIAYTSSDFQTEFKENKNVIFLGNRSNKKILQKEKSFDDKSLIYISFGTLFNCDFNVLSKLIDFFENTSYELIISTGGNKEVYNKLLEKKVSKKIKIYEFVEQEDVLSKASLFITHVGASSLYEAIRFAVPMIMIPHMEEQAFNAHKAKKLKLGYILDSKDLSKKDIQKALDNIKRNWRKYRDASFSIRKTFVNSLNAEGVSLLLSEFVRENERKF
ncbi:MAG: hypothetical protein K2Q34_04300 [Alphaproteobacteria bacterium]|nr:hypothetical protein [Alphaproteobacteria bacterium]